jgi:hypothetical protein
MDSSSELFSQFLSKNVGRKTTLMFSDRKFFDEFLKINEKVKSNTDHSSVILLDYYLYPLLENKNLNFQFIFDFVDETNLLKLKEDSERMAKTWYEINSSGLDPTNFDSLSLGVLYQHDMAYMFHRVCNAIENVAAFFRKEKPEALIILTGSFSSPQNFRVDVENNIYQKLIKTFAKNNKTPIYEFSFPLNNKPGNKNHTFENLKFQEFSILNGLIKTRLPKFLLDKIKFIYLAFGNIRSKWNKQSNAPTILFPNPVSANYYGKQILNRLTQSYNIIVYRGESRNPKVHNFHYFFSNPIPKEKRRHFKDSMEAAFKTWKSSNYVKENLKYRNISIAELFLDVFKSIFLNSFPTTFKDNCAIKKLLKNTPVKLILIHTDWPLLERTACLLGKKQNIPTLNYQHGIEGVTPLGFPRYAKHKATWGHKRKDWLIKNGHPKESISIVGSPFQSEETSLSSNMTPDFDKPGTLLYLTHEGRQYVGNREVMVDSNQKIFHCLLEVMKKIPQKTLIVKIRPTDPQRNFYSDLIKKSGCLNIIVTHKNLLGLIDECDLFLTLFSTAGAEALLKGRPGIQITFIDKDRKTYNQALNVHDIPYAEYNATLDMDEEDPEKLLELIKSIYNSNEIREKLKRGRRKFLEDYCNLGKGNSADNLQNFIYKIINS